ncbi:hypothetical protein Zm00014a_011367, partial [Zea mays]
PSPPEPVSSSPVELRRALSPSELRSGVRNPERAPIPSPPPYFSARAHPSFAVQPPPSTRVSVASPSPRGVPGARLEVTDPSSPYRPLFCSLLRLIARRSRLTPPPSRPAVNRPPPVPLPRPKPYRRTPRALPDLPDHSDCPRALPVARAPRLGEPSAAGTSAAAPASRRGSPGRPPDPHRPSQIGRPRFNLSKPNPGRPPEIQRPRPASPSPRLSAVWAQPVSPPARSLCPPGPACQPPARSLCPPGPACQSPARPRRLPGPACQPLPPPRARAPARRI